MSAASRIVSKQLLFFITLLFAIAPACRHKSPKMAHADALIASGSTFTALGGATATVTAVGTALGTGVDLAMLGLYAAGIIAAPFAAVFLIIGIPLLVVGIKKKKALKKQRMLEQQKQAQAVLHHTPLDTSTLERKNLSEQD